MLTRPQAHNSFPGPCIRNMERATTFNLYNVFSGVAAFALGAIVSTADIRADDASAHAKASVPEGTIRLLTAPHIGKTICEIPDRTGLELIRYARHGPHEFAEVRVLQGACEGKDGYIPAGSIDPPS